MGDLRLAGDQQPMPYWSRLVTGRDGGRARAAGQTTEVGAQTRTGRRGRPAPSSLGPPCPLLHPASPAHLPPLAPFALTGGCLSHTRHRPSWAGRAWLTCPFPPTHTPSWWHGAPAFSPAWRCGPPAPAETERWVCLAPELGSTGGQELRGPSGLSMFCPLSCFSLEKTRLC